MAGGTAPWSVRIPVRRVLQQNGTAAEAGVGRRRGGCTTQIPGLVAGVGNPVRRHRTPGHAHARPPAPTLVEGEPFARVRADRGYGRPGVRALGVARGGAVVSPPHPRSTPPRAVEGWWDRERQVVAGFVNTITPFRRVFSRFAKLAQRYLGCVHLTSVLIWLR